MSSLSPPLLEADGRHLEETMAVFPPFCLLSTTLEFFRALFLFYWRCSSYGTIIVSLQPAQFRGVPLAYSWGFITSMWPRTQPQPEPGTSKSAAMWRQAASKVVFVVGRGVPVEGVEGVRAVKVLLEEDFLMGTRSDGDLGWPQTPDTGFNSRPWTEQQTSSLFIEQQYTREVTLFLVSRVK